MDFKNRYIGVLTVLQNPHLMPFEVCILDKIVPYEQYLREFISKESVTTLNPKLKQCGFNFEPENEKHVDALIQAYLKKVGEVKVKKLNECVIQIRALKTQLYTDEDIGIQQLQNILKEMNSLVS